MMKRVTIRKIGTGYVVNYGGEVVDVAKNKSEATTKANNYRKKIKRKKR